MNSVLLSTSYIYSLLLDPDIELIEVWSRVLYARMRKGSGKRNKFISKLGLEYQLPVYYDVPFKKVSRRYHPDRAGKNVSKQRTLTKLFQHIGISRFAMERLFAGRRLSGISFTLSNDVFRQFASSSLRSNPVVTIQQVDREIQEAGYIDSELFGRYCTDPENEQTGEWFQYIDDCKEIVQKVKESFARRTEEFYQQLKDISQETYEWHINSVRELGF